MVFLMSRANQKIPWIRLLCFRVRLLLFERVNLIHETAYHSPVCIGCSYKVTDHENKEAKRGFNM